MPISGPKSQEDLQTSPLSASLVLQMQHCVSQSKNSNEEPGALKWVFELNFNKKIIARIFAIILTNISVKTYIIISVNLHRH